MKPPIIVENQKLNAKIQFILSILFGVFLGLQLYVVLYYLSGAPAPVRGIQLIRDIFLCAVTCFCTGLLSLGIWHWFKGG